MGGSLGAPVTAANVAAVRQIAGAAGLTVEPHHTGPAYGLVRLYGTAADLLVALVVLAMTVGLIRTESASEMHTLAATGAAGRTRRAIVGVTAGGLGLVGGVLGVLGTYVALLAWNRSNVSPLGSGPIADVLMIVFGLPLLACAGGWLLAGREPPAVARAPLG